jgi:hypothetical protein
MVMLAVPVVAVLLAEKVTVELPLPGAAMEVGLKVAVTPAGNPEADNETAELKPPLTVVETVELPELPCVTDTLAGAALTAKSGVAAELTVRAIVVVCVTAPPVAVIVILAVPVVAVLLAEKVTVELPLPGAAMEVGLKLAVTPAGNPEADNETAELKPPLTVVDTVELPELPCVTDTLAGETLTAKSGVAAELTVRAIVVVCVTVPPVAVMVMLAVPVVVVLLAVKVRVELPPPGAAMEAGLKLAVTPAGNPEADNETAELKPPLTVVEIVEAAEDPWVTLSVAGVAVTAKSAVGCFHTSEMGVAVAAPPTRVNPYRSSTVRRTLKWLMVSANCPCLTIGPTKMVAMWLPLALSSSSQVTINRLLWV